MIDPLQSAIGKTIKAVGVSKDGPEIDLTFTDGTSLSILNTSRPSTSIMYFWGEKDDQCARKTVTVPGAG